MENSCMQFSHIWEKYRIKFIKNKQVTWRDNWVLKDINFSIKRGETLCIVGANGAGKTTILKLVAGMIDSDKGEVTVDGNVTGLIDLGTEFDMQLTGEENIYLSAGLFGLKKEQIKKQFDNIVNFTGIGEFIYAPVKNYSQGMYIRLAFAIAVHSYPDILLIDDILAVGDRNYQEKCINKIFDLKEKGVSIIYVTHNMSMAKKLCTRGIFLRNGEIVKDGNIEEIVSLYLNSINKNNINEMSLKQKKFKLLNNTIKNDRLELFCNEGKVRLFCDGKELTNDKGIFASFKVGGKCESSIQSRCVVSKESKNKMIICFNWEGLPIKQIWEFTIESNSLLWQIKISAEKNIKVEDRAYKVSLLGKYKKWITENQSGIFKAPVWDKKTGIVHLDKNKCRILGVDNIETEKYNLPAVIFDSYKKISSKGCSISKMVGDSNSVDLFYFDIDNRDSCFFPRGEHICFRGKISVLEPGEGKIYLKENKNDIKYKKSISEFNIKKGALQFLFEEGVGRIFWEGKEITSGLGMYTSVYSKNIWFDSRYASWKLTKHKNSINAVGFWWIIPIMQNWTIKIIDSNTLSWEIMMGIFDDVNIEKEQINIMMSSDYKRWEVPSFSHGIFPADFNYYRGEFWDRMWSGFCDELSLKDRLGLQNGGIDKVSFENLVKENQHHAVVENTDSLFKSRIMQYQKINFDEKSSFTPCNYLYFKGRIKINCESNNGGFI